MPPLDAHLKSSRERTGKEHREVHEWLDADPRRAAERHDITRIHEHGETIREQYGSEALAEYIEHIRDDVRGKFSGIHDDYEKNITDALMYFGCG